MDWGSGSYFGVFVAEQTKHLQVNLLSKHTGGIDFLVGITGTLWGNDTMEILPSPKVNIWNTWKPFDYMNI